jgi:hydrogenase/urease accessory protein HupE
MTSRVSARVRAGLTTLAFLGAVPASAHLMPAQQGTLNIVDNTVFTVVSLPASALDGVDDNLDGRLSADELNAHLDAVKQQVARRLRLRDGEVGGEIEMLMPMAEADERDPPTASGSRNFTLLMKTRFAMAPQALRIDTDLFGIDGSERQLTLKASRGDELEAVVLTPNRHRHDFFRSPWRVLADYIVLGVEHILLGPDHLLFLLTIIIAAAGWRYWLGVLTSFTVAHSITLTLSLCGRVSAPAALVEPLIAVSIVLMALLNLGQRKVVIAQRVAIVFACGLLHGLGFAASIADIGLAGAYRLASIIGFNLGIELGQALFLAAILVLMVGSRRILSRLMAQPGERFPLPVLRLLSAGQVASVVAILVGAFWLLQRLGVLG